jgi:hypothetical protein
MARSVESGRASARAQVSPKGGPAATWRTFKAHMTYSVEWISGDEDFARLGPQWDRLAGDDSTPFDTHAWYRAWWKAFGSPGELALCVAWRDDRLAAVLPLFRSPGGRLRAMANTHSPSFRPLWNEPAALGAVLKATLRSGAGSVELAPFPQGDAGAPLLSALSSAMRAPHVSEPLYASPIVSTVGSFDEWRAASKPRWGAPLERFRRNLLRAGAEFSIVERPVNLESELTSGFAVEASGWKGETGSAITSSPQTECFYRSVASVFHARRELRLSRIELPDGMAAFDLCLLHNGRLYLLKTGFDEQFRKRAPGLVLRLSTIERCFELGLTAHELLGADEGWKLKFSTTKTAYCAHRLYARRPVPLMRWTYRSAVRPTLRRVYRAVKRQAR